MSLLPPTGAGGTPPSYPVAPQYPAGAGQQLSAPGPAPGVVYAGFGARFLGYVIDSLLLTAVQLLLYVPLFIQPLLQYYQAHPIRPGQVPTIPSDYLSRLFLITLIVAVVTALYFGGLVAWQGHTLGQRVMRMEVVRAEDGGKLPPGRALLRSTIYWLPGIAGLIAYLGFAVLLAAIIGMVAVAWDPRKQGWHDKLARSMVVKRVGGEGRPA